jgi:hypothetical protein
MSSHDMLQLIDPERFLIDHMFPSDKKSLQINKLQQDTENRSRFFVSGV